MYSKFEFNKSTLLLLLITTLTIFENVLAEKFPLAIVHINDFHARFEPTDVTGGTCSVGEACIGGYARTVYTVRRLLEEHKDKNPVYFNAGDSFQGTLWYNIGRWNVTSQFLNILPADAMTLGNHEFDHGIEGVVPFLEHINTTMLVANIDATDEPTMIGKFKKSTMLVRSNRKIGVIGVILETTYDLASTGKLKFRNESVAIREEAEKLKAEGANIIIVISHCGYDVDQIIANQVGDEIDVIVGAHSHTFLYTGEPLPGPEKPRGPYPTEVVHKSGNRVLIVQAAAYARYVGNLVVYFDDDGKILEHEGAPVYMGSSVPEDAIVKAALVPWQQIIDEQGNVVIGATKVDLVKSSCSGRECNLGNFFCDAMMHSFIQKAPLNKDQWTDVAIGLVNTGSLRVPLYRGNITYAHMVTMSPFENTLLSFNLPGDKLLEALEYSVLDIDVKNNVTSSRNFLQVAGLKVTFDFAKEPGSRVVDLKVRCAACPVPTYEKFDATKTYRIAAPNFLADGGDGFHMLRDYGTDRRGDTTDLDALLEYTKIVNPIYTGNEGRMTVLNGGTFYPYRRR